MATGIIHKKILYVCPAKPVAFQVGANFVKMGYRVHYLVDNLSCKDNIFFRRMKVLKSMEGEGFFNTMRGEMVNIFFNNPRVWAVAGWEGASYDKGGYYLRGFQDADWPQPPEDASPKGWWE